MSKLQTALGRARSEASKPKATEELILFPFCTVGADASGKGRADKGH